MIEERRVVTVLFADIVGSTAIAETSDPEDVRALQSTYSRIAREVLSRHGGTVEKFIGDAVMAVFGVPQAHDDDPDRALMAGLALRDALTRDPLTTALSLRIGVNSGEVIAARDARSEMLVSGDTVNVAARIQQAAAPGEILVGERTIVATRRLSRFGDTRPLEVRGRAAPVTVAPLLAQDAVLMRWPEPPFVGREVDLAQLSLVAMRAFTEARPQFVTVSAPVGTGKSRLIGVFTSRVKVLRPNIRLATAQVLPYGSGTYLPMRTLLASLMRAKEPALDISSIGRALADRMPSPEAERIAALVAETLGLATQRAKHEREEFFAAWRVCVERFAADAPTILVLEDVHWATESLLDLIEHITQAKARAPLLMVALTRPELFDRRPTWGTAQRNATSISLEPLGPDETKQLLRAVMPDAPPVTLERLADRAEGNPFFAVELARSLREHGEGAALPDTVQASVLARLDLLPQAERRTLQLGSVIGRSFPPRTLALVGGIDTAASLEALMDRDLLVAQLDGTYAFRHIVIREVAYGTLPRTERANAHLELARSLSNLPETPAEIVAHHYRQALISSPRSLSDDELRRAIDALENAASFAKRTGADREAEDLLRAAIQFAPSEAQARLYERLGDAVEITDEAAVAYSTAFARWEAIAPRLRRAADGARLLRKRAIVYVRWRGSIRSAPPLGDVRLLLQRARALLVDARDKVESAHVDVAEVFLAGSPRRDELGPDRMTVEEALARGEAAKASFARRADVNAESEALGALAALTMREGMIDRTIQYSRARQRLAGTSLLERADASAMVCWGLSLLERFDEVLEAFHAYVASLRPGEPEGFYAYPHTHALQAAYVRGEWDEALRIADRLANFAESQARWGRTSTAARSLHLAAHIAHSRLDDARYERYLAAAASGVDGRSTAGSTSASHRLHFAQDGSVAIAYLRQLGASDPLGPSLILVMLLLELDLQVDEETLRHVEEVARPRSMVLSRRIELVRAASAGAASLREVINRLDQAGYRAEAARASGLAARMSRSPADRADAVRRLHELGDRVYVARLDDPFLPR